MPNTQTIKFAGIRTSGIQPSGTINLTNTSLTDVSQYQYAQIVDSNLLAANIKSGVSVLGVTGSYSGSGDPAYYSQRLVEGSLNTINETTIGRPSNIRNQCFINQNIYDLDLPSSVTAIKSSAFSGCTFYNPTHFNLSSTLREIGSGAFNEVSFSSISEEYIISIPNTVTSIENGNFNSVSNTNVKFKMSENIASIGASCFNQDNNYTHGLTNINGVYYLDGNTTSHIAAIKTNSKGADIASGTKVIARDCFKNSEFSMLGLPESVIGFGGELTSSKYPDVYYAGSELPNAIQLFSDHPISKIHLNATTKTYSFNTNGADSATPASYTGIILPDSAKPADPTKTGKYFWGWYDTDWTNDLDGSQAVQFPLYRASATTFNARWEDTPLQETEVE